MSSDSDLLLGLHGVAKAYPLRPQPAQELWRRLTGAPAHAGSTRHALQALNLEVRRGQSVGIVGLNGAGKSTLLQLASGVLTPTEGSVVSRGSVAALLELGAGFNPEATGRDNIYLYAATLGLPRSQIDAAFPSILAFSGLESFIDAPVKTYSSGMQVRLAFAVATSAQPDLLIVDEALSVGDGVFAKRSFDRIMELRDRGTALLLSSHALFHIDLFCDRTLWLHQGTVRAWGDTRRVLPQYQAFLDQLSGGPTHESQPESPAAPAAGAAPSLFDGSAPLEVAQDGAVQLLSAQVEVDGRVGSELQARAQHSRLRVRFEVKVSAAEPQPRAAVVISSESGLILGSALSPENRLQVLPNGQGHIEFEWNDLPLNRGRYRVGVYLLCSRARFVYAWSDPHAHLEVVHEGPHQGSWILPGAWR